jgi:hypothetical protein
MYQRVSLAVLAKENYLGVPIVTLAVLAKENYLDVPIVTLAVLADYIGNICRRIKVEPGY